MALPHLADIQMGDDHQSHRAVRYRLPNGAFIDICRDVRHAEDNGLINREMQRSHSFTGISTCMVASNASNAGCGWPSTMDGMSSPWARSPLG
jgi:hypothetical protein